MWTVEFETRFFCTEELVVQNFSPKMKNHISSLAPLLIMPQDPLVPLDDAFPLYPMPLNAAPSFSI